MKTSQAATTKRTKLKPASVAPMNTKGPRPPRLLSAPSFLKPKLPFSSLAEYKQFWTDPSIPRRFLDHLQAQTPHRSVEGPSALYSLQRRTIIANGGSYLLRLHKGSLIELFRAAYPNHTWQGWRLSRTPSGYWPALASSLAQKANDAARYNKAVSELTSYVKQQEASLGVKSPGEWPEALRKANTSLKRHLEQLGGLPHVLSLVYPDYKLPPNVIASVQPIPIFSKSYKRGYWISQDRRVEYLDFLKEQLGGRMEDFYQIRGLHFKSTGGIRLLRRHGDAPSKVVMEAYPSHPWRPWKFSHTTATWWRDLGDRLRAGQPQAMGYVREYFAELEKSLGITAARGWLNLPVKSLKPTDIWRVTKLGGLSRVLATLYPSELPGGTRLIKTVSETKEAKQKKRYASHRQAKHQLNFAKQVSKL